MIYYPEARIKVTIEELEPAQELRVTIQLPGFELLELDILDRLPKAIQAIWSLNKGKPAKGLLQSHNS